MGSVILISTVAILVAVVGCFFIWRADAARAEEVEHQAPPPERARLGSGESSTPPRSLRS
ncbi:hypothetical protein F4692_001258 [Nocardioides cavernae]|uniref:Uncharacterized protein n=1 Tax=Nocardioides cavernae TaxID=1921566 RepID=A0A7Y9H1B5_9ACTN|nr:hypothetical protein [Nocardioides cavernae]NYE36154.1 hypothetical protein [Nocardioides cavernae]